MPKEKIYDQSNLFDIEVGWAHDRDVQIGLTTRDGRSLADWLAGSEHDRPPTPQVGDATDAPRGTAGTAHGIVYELAQFDSLWASLDRVGINRLIKMLRKARDEAYGRDE